MIYRAIGVTSNASSEGLDMVFVEFDENRGIWGYEVKATTSYEHDAALKEQLKNAASLSIKDYLLLHTSFGRYIGEQINNFIDENDLHHKVQLIVSLGHTIFHSPEQSLTAALGEGAAIAATTEINVVSDLRNMDVALGGSGEPIYHLGEKLLSAELQINSHKETVAIALLGVLRWREENTMLNEITGAKRSSIGGAVWIGQEA